MLLAILLTYSARPTQLWPLAVLAKNPVQCKYNRKSPPFEVRVRYITSTNRTGKLEIWSKQFERFVVNHLWILWYFYNASASFRRRTQFLTRLHQNRSEHQEKKEKKKKRFFFFPKRARTGISRPARRCGEREGDGPAVSGASDPLSALLRAAAICAFYFS